MRGPSTESLKQCDNPLCDRKTKVGVKYCCGPCATAHEGKYEIHESGLLGHTDSCDKRHSDRTLKDVEGKSHG